MKKFFISLGALFSVSYPFFVFYFLNKDFSFRFMSLFLLILASINFIKNKQKIILILTLFLATGLFIWNNDLFMRFYPVLMNISVATLFLLSLKNTPLILKFAEKSKTSLTPQVIAYCKKSTLYWGIFLFVNAIFSLITVFLSLKIWTIYNGFISYILIGTIAGTEFLIRKHKEHELKKSLC